MANSGDATIKNSFSSTNVTSDGKVGGLIGATSGSSSHIIDVSNSYASGNVNSTSSFPMSGTAGGLIGATYYTKIENTYALGNVIAANDVGGLIGTDAGSSQIIHSYASGAVSTSANPVPRRLGGLLGNGSSTITSSYWDSTTTGQQYAVGGGTNTTGAITNSNAYTQANYSGFDFTSSGAWFSVDGYTRPFLRMEASNTIANAHELQLMSMNLSNDYKLANDINLAPSLTNKSEMWKDNSASVDFSNYKGSFVPVGNTVNATFEGDFDCYQRCKNDPLATE